MELAKGRRITGDKRTEMALELKKRYEAGESIRTLAEGTGRSYGFVHACLTEAGVPLRSRGGSRRRGGA